MDAALQSQLTIAALVCSVLALFFSLLAAFPGLKLVLAAVRDGVLWFALFLVLGGSAFIAWQQYEADKKAAPSGPQQMHAGDKKLAQSTAH
jgi:H+/Cl- antiporter ClcA